MQSDSHLVKAGTQRLRTLDSQQVSTRALIITALVTGLAILVAFAAAGAYRYLAQAHVALNTIKTLFRVY